MHFHKLIWRIIIVGMVLCIILLLFSIFSKLTISHPTNTAASNTDAAILTERNSATDTIRLPIVMYHALIDDKSKQNKYFISPDIFENDLKYLTDNGYNTITMTELINYVHKGIPLPEKPILLTFDDGYYNNYVYAYPALKKYNQKAVISIIGSQTDMYSLIKEKNTYYSHLTWDQLNEMIISQHVEIQNHTYNMHTYNNGRKGCMDRIGENIDDYRIALTEDIGLLQTKITDYTGITPNTMTYPFGYFSRDTEKVIKEMGFQASLTCSERVNKITRDPECLYRLGRFLRPPDKSSADFFEKLLD